jgi:hypothetical protein
MRRRRNLLLPSYTRVKVSRFSSFAVSSKPSSSNCRVNSQTSTKLHPAQFPLPPHAFGGSKNSTLSRNFQTRSPSRQETGGTSEFDETGVKFEEVSYYNSQRTGIRKPSKEVPVSSFLVRRDGGPQPARASVRERVIQLTPWRGTPSLLHALGFIQELEEKYGKIWWAGLSKVCTLNMIYSD